MTEELLFFFALERLKRLILKKRFELEPDSNLIKPDDLFKNCRYFGPSHLM